MRLAVEKTQILSLAAITVAWLFYLSSADWQSYLWWQPYLLTGRWAMVGLGAVTCVLLLFFPWRNALTCYLCICMVFQASCAVLEPATSKEYYDYVSYFFLMACLSYKGELLPWAKTVGLCAVLTHTVPLFFKSPTLFSSLGVVVFTFSTPIAIFFLSIIIVQLNTTRFVAMASNLLLHRKLLDAEKNAKKILIEELEKAREQIHQTAKIFAIAKTTQMLAHDVRKPFLLLRSVIDTLTNTENLAQLVAQAQRSLPEVERALTAVDAVLGDIMLIDTNTPPQLESVSPAILIEQALPDALETGEREKLKISRHFSHRYQVQVDRARIRRVFANILANAVRATRGEGHIWFQTRQKTEQVEFVIGNDGPCIPPAVIANIFQPFFTRGKKDGTGLGLAIVQKVIESHRGKVWCSSDQFGTEFHFTLPASSKVDTTVHEASSFLPRRRMIFVDDSVIFRMKWEEIREADVYAVACPEDLLANAKKNKDFINKFEFIVTDYHFGHDSQETGITLATKLRRIGYSHPIYLASSAVFGEVSKAITAVIDKDPVKGWKQIQAMEY